MEELPEEMMGERIEIPGQGVLFDQESVDVERQAHQDQVETPMLLVEQTPIEGIKWLGRRALEFIKAIPVGHIYERKD